MRKFVRRSRSRFRSAKAAWEDVHRRTGLTPALVQSAHTHESWCWLITKKGVAPAGKRLQRDAVRLYRGFHGRRPRQARRVEAVDVPSVTVKLGGLVQINYKRVENGKTVEFFHRFKSPRPVLASDPNGCALFILGGKYKIEDVGIIG